MTRKSVKGMRFVLSAIQSLMPLVRPTLKSHFKENLDGLIKQVLGFRSQKSRMKMTKAQSVVGEETDPSQLRNHALCSDQSNISLKDGNY